jgi:hypothetical protein
MGRYGNYIVPGRDAWKSRSENPADKYIESLDATSVRRLGERAAASDAQKAAAEQFMLDEKTFCTMYPAYKDTERNKNAMVLLDECSRCYLPSYP